MGIIEGARHRVPITAGVAGDITGYGPFVHTGTVSGGTPVDGTAGTQAGVAQPGAILISAAATKLFINTNTLASPTWTVVGGQS